MACWLLAKKLAFKDPPSLKFHDWTDINGPLPTKVKFIEKSHQDTSPNGLSIRAGSVKKYSEGQVSKNIPGKNIISFWLVQILLKVRNIAQLIWNTNPGFEYQSQTFDNDFVILKLDGALEFNNDIRPACLPSSTDYLDMNSTEDECFTSGWGTLQVGKNFTYHIVRNSIWLKKNRASDYEGKFHSFLMCRIWIYISQKLIS